MSTITEDVAAWLSAGEGQHTEFKEKYTSRVIESLAAFANTAGGRVLSVTALGRDIEQAARRAYRGVKEIHFNEAQFRRDIGLPQQRPAAAPVKPKQRPASPPKRR